MPNHSDDDALLHACEEQRDHQTRLKEAAVSDPTITTNPAEAAICAMQFSQSIGNLAAALSAAQGQMRNPSKTKTAKVLLKNGGNYQFSYADLADVFDAIRQPLADNGLSIIQAPAITYHPDFPPVIAVTTRILHASGEWVENTVKMIAEESRPQVVASAITYAKRYAVQAMLAIVAEEDDDGNAASGNQASVEQRQRSAAPAQRQTNRQPAAQPHAPADAREAMKAEHDRLVAALVAKLGDDEAQHQVAAIKKRCGTDYAKALSEIRAYNDSIPGGDK